MGTTHPLYLRSKPTPRDPTMFASNTDYIDLRNVHLPPLGASNPVAEAAGLFDSRAAAAVSAATGFENGVQLFPSGNLETLPQELLEKKDFGDKAPEVIIPTAKCLAVLAYPDFFPVVPANFFPDLPADRLRGMVSEAILAANPGWCGTFGPGVDSTIDVIDLFGDHEEGNYDMSQMHLLQIAYRFYDELSPEAQEHLIMDLLAKGRIRRPNLADIFTSGGAPNDWSRAGFLEVPLPVLGDLLGVHVKAKRIGETENHILTIHTARYLTNQLLYQRDHDPSHDNRRNGTEDASTCTELMLGLLRNILRDDFSEYNAKNYQNETRSALLNLCSYAYDHEVRLGARMVLDYISAHIAVSSNDLRRMVPFRRRNEGIHVRQFDDGYMGVGLLETSLGADPMTQRFAILAGNTRAYEMKSDDRPHDWSIATNGENGNEAVVDALSDYRLPPSIHDLFVNDLHRRFFQRLHRIPQDDPEVTGRNCDNYELYAGSPSYLITAGGSPSTYAIDPHFAGVVVGDQTQQLGVAVTTSFMPTRINKENPGTGMGAMDLIQFSSFSDIPDNMDNYGVAPDFACGHRVHIPEWYTPQRLGKFDFVDRGSAGNGPGFYLALFRDGDLTAMEAFDTWLHPDLSFDQFKNDVLEKNKHLIENGLSSNVDTQYTTQNGNRLHFVIWKDGERDGVAFNGAKILNIEYGTGPSADPVDSEGDAGNTTDKFLNGTVMNSKEEGVVEITNHFLGTTIRLDMNDPRRPRRTSESGEVEEAGSNNEVWVDFDWQGPNEGDFFHPFNTIAGATVAVADGGVIKIMPGTTRETSLVNNNKRVRLVAPLGGVTIGAS